MSTILVSGVEFYGYHGVSDHEQQVGHRFTVDIELEAETRATVTDEVADTVDYGAVALVIISIGQAKVYRTVERLATVMAEHLLAEFPMVTAVTIELVKLLPPVPATIQAAGIRLIMMQP